MVPPSEQSSTTRADPRKVAQTIKAIHAFYSAGLQSLDDYPGRLAYGQMEDEARRYRIKDEMLRKARVFADPKAGGYTERQMDRLCERIEKAGLPRR